MNDTVATEDQEQPVGCHQRKARVARTWRNIKGPTRSSANRGNVELRLYRHPRTSHTRHCLYGARRLPWVFAFAKTGLKLSLRANRCRRDFFDLRRLTELPLRAALCMFQACPLPSVSPRTGVGHRSLEDVRAMQLLPYRKKRRLPACFRNCRQRLPRGRPRWRFTVDVSLRPTPIASSPSPVRIETLFAHRKRRPVSSRRLRGRGRQGRA